MKKQLFINLPVKDLKKSMSFFSGLGYEFNSKFTNDDGACMIIGDNIFAMLLTEPFFKNFIPTTTISDAKKQTEVLICTNAESKEKVDTIFNKALTLGGTSFRPAQDHGSMYAQSFQDLDGHIWEVMWMDPKVMEG
jgi:predicted lactoylglutathione lyase